MLEYAESQYSNPKVSWVLRQHGKIINFALSISFIYIYKKI